MDIHRTTSPTMRFAALAFGALLVMSACSSSADEDDAGETTTTEAGSAVPTDAGETTATTDAGTDTTAAPSDIASTASCDEVAALFATRGSANADLADPEVAASCEGDTIVITSNGIPDFTYIETSPGQPRAADYVWSIPASPMVGDATTEIPYIGPIGTTLSGIPIYGPTEGTGGDVDSLPGIVSVCGSHNGPTGFHTHKIGTSSETDCFFTPEEVADEPQLVGYAWDGFPIYTGIDQYTSSWQLTDESLFASDTWAAHSYVEGSGDLDECNGLTDADGNYAYYTTEGFPYIMGCFAGEVEIAAPGGGDAGGGERPEQPAGEDDGAAARPEPVDGENSERPEPPADGERPEPPADDALAPPEEDQE